MGEESKERRTGGIVRRGVERQIEDRKLLERPDGAPEFLESDPWRVLRIQAEFVAGFDALATLGPAVTFFGSARVRPPDPMYDAARALAAELARRGFAIITGGGPGVMEAANMGAREGRALGPGPQGRHRRHPARRRHREAVLPAKSARGPAEGTSGTEEERRSVTASVEVTFLTDRGQPAEQFAGELAGFIGAAQRSLDIAIYDLNLTGGPAEQVRSAVRAVAARGVAVRLLYNVDFPNPIPVPPPSQADTAFIASLGVPTKPVSGVPDLMHHKYIVRDASTDAAAIWTGSTNGTNDSWTKEENVIVRIPSTALAAEYAKNFGELWDAGRVEGSGKYDLAGVPVAGQDNPVRVHAFFAPGRGRQMAHAIADRITHARRRIRVCSPVITAGVILGTLGDLAHRAHPEFKGVYDRTQMAEVLGQWRVDPHATWKGPAVQAVSAALPFASKVTN